MQKRYRCFQKVYLRKVSESGASSQFLQEAKIPIIDFADCKDLYENAVNEDSMFCAGSAKGDIDSCQGDSGGPLIVLENERPILVGLVSWGVGCGRQGHYGVYAKVMTIIRNCLTDDKALIQIFKLWCTAELFFPIYFFTDNFFF